MTKYRLIGRAENVRVRLDETDINILIGDSWYSVRNLIETKLFITDKNSIKTTLKLNRAQEMLYLRICHNLVIGKPCRFIILKARQLGMTTFISAFLYIMTMFRPNQNSVILANTSENANKIFAKYRMFQNNIELEFPSAARELESKTGNQLITKHNSSSLRVVPANEDAVRGTTITGMHGSETGFWDNIDRTLAAVKEAMPETNPLTFLFLESTANGYNEFKEYRDLAIANKNEVGGYEPIFFPRFIDQDYKLTEPLKLETLSDFELERMNRYTLDLYQMAFFRSKYIGLKKNLDLTLQEYPFSPSDAFVSTGNGVFDNALIEKRKEEVSKNVEYRTGFIRYKVEALGGNADEQMLSEIKFVVSDYGYLRIFEDVLNGVPYVVGCDMALGKGHDESAVFVIRNDTKVQVASMHSNSVNPRDFARSVVALCIYYNNALLVPEVNMGTTLLQVCKDVNYTNIYLRETDNDRLYDDVLENYGIKTSIANKSNIIEYFREMCESFTPEYANIKDYFTLIEMQNFIYEPSKTDSGKAKLKGAGASHDDLVMAAALCYYGHTQQTTLVSTNETETEKKYRHRLFSSSEEEERDSWENIYL